MIRGTWVWRKGRLVEKGGPDDERLVPPRSELSAPLLNSDNMDAVEHPCTGRFYSSKSTFSRITREHGMVEMGNDPARLRPKAKPLPDRQAIRDSVKRAFQRAGVA